MAYLLKDFERDIRKMVSDGVLSVEVASKILTLASRLVKDTCDACYEQGMDDAYSDYYEEEW